MSEKEKIVIIGAGIAGLSAGIYLQKNGYHTEIYEQHYIPGGVCTGWYKNGYYIDGCIHWLMGTKDGTGYRRMWDELKVLADVPIYQPETFLTVELSNGQIIEIHSKLDEWCKELLLLAPEDKKFIDELSRSLKALAKAEIFFEKPNDIQNVLDKLKNLVQLGPALKVFGKYSKLSIAQLAEHLHSPLLKELVREIIGIDDFSAISLFTTLNNFFTGNGGIPEGGSLAFAKRMAAQYRELGGQLKLNNPVQKIVLDGNLATGIEVNDCFIAADRVVSAVDGNVMYAQLLGGQYENHRIQEYYQKNKTFHPLLIVSFGADGQLEDIPKVFSFPVKEGIDIGNGKRIHRLKIRNHNYDPTLNSKKGATLQVNIFTEWEYWDELYSNPELYQAKKDEVATNVLQAIENRFPELKGKLTCIDVATPKTFFHFTSVWKGAFEGWMLTPDNMSYGFKKQVEGLENVYHIGQWTTPGGGVAIAAKDGRDLAQIICHLDKRSFV